MADWKIKQLNHVVIWCRDIERSIAFYEQLGLRIQERRMWDNALRPFVPMICAPHQHFDLRPDPAWVAPPRDRSGLQGMSFRIESPHPIDRAVQHLAGQGIPAERLQLDAGAEGAGSFEVHDPDNLRIELHINYTGTLDGQRGDALAPVTWRIQQLDHVVLRCHDIEESTEFYEHLGFEVARQGTDGQTWLRAGNEGVKLVSDATWVPPERERNNVQHVNFVIDGPHKLEELIASLATKGITPDRPMELYQHSGTFEVYDPDNVRLEIRLHYRASWIAEGAANMLATA
jgi:catechol 2,3-dioxygenase-like lactoylglutathione lyase family enzyme